MEWHPPLVGISVSIFGQLVSDCVKPAPKASMAEDRDPPVVDLLDIELVRGGTGSMELLSVVIVVTGSEVHDQGYSFREELSASLDHTEPDKGQIRVSGIRGEKKATYSDILRPVPRKSLGGRYSYVSQVQHPLEWYYPLSGDQTGCR